MKSEEMKITELFDTSHTLAAELFEGKTYAWEVLEDLSHFIEELGPKLPQDEYQQVRPGVWIHKTARLVPNVVVGSRAIIGPRVEVRPGAFIRGRVIIGADCVIGNSCELKNAILFDGVQVPHFNYVGDSILGTKSHLGAGAVTSNVKSDKTLVKVHAEDGDIETGLKKLGAIVGDGVEVGCNSVLNPGTVIGKNSIVYPLSSVRGCVPANSIYKGKDEIVAREEQAPEKKAPAKRTRAKKSEKAESGKGLKVVK